MKDAYPILRIDESLSKLGDAKLFTTLDLVLPFGRSLYERKRERERRLDSHVNWCCTSGKDVLCLLQRHSDLAKTDGSGFDQSKEEVV